MDDDPADIAKVPLHKDARALIRERSQRFGATLTAQAKLIAKFNGYDLVLTKHVQEALDVLHGPRPRPWVNEVASTLGGIVLGIGASSFISEVSRADGPRGSQTVVFVVLTIVGVATVLIAALTKR